MKPPICRVCHKAEWNHVCSGPPLDQPYPDYPADVSPRKKGKASAHTRKAAPASSPIPTPPLHTTHTQTSPAFDRRSYQRQYMRKRRADHSWAVYILIDPRDGIPFYVGCSQNPAKRLIQHETDRASSAWQRIQDLNTHNLKCSARTILRVNNKETALFLEREMINALTRVFPSKLFNLPVRLRDGRTTRNSWPR